MVRIRRGRLVVPLVTALLSVAVLEPGRTVAASCSGQSHNLLLSSGSASPGMGSPGTSFRFTVTYADNAGCSPDRVVVVVDGVGEFSLTWVSGDLTNGAAFEESLNLPTGTHGYRYEAASGTGAGQMTVILTNVNPAAVVVVPPASPPTPPPTPRPRPVPTPTPAPTSPPTEVPPSPTATPPTATASTPPESPSSTAPSPSAATPSRIEGPAEGSAGGPVAVAPSSSPPPTAGQEASPASASTQTTFDLNGLPPPWLKLGVAGFGTITGLGFFMVLSAWLLGSSRGAGFRHAVAAGRRTRRQLPNLEPTRPVARANDDAVMPIAGADQFRRGSIARTPILFNTAPLAGIDRCRVASRLVPLRSEPDELSQAHSLRLDVGDEVEVLHQEGPYCFVRTAAGAEGWVPGLTLAGVAGTAQPIARDDEQ